MADKLEIVGVSDLVFGTRGVASMTFQCVRSGFIGPGTALRLRLKDSDLPSRERAVVGETVPEKYYPISEALRSALEAYTPILEAEYERQKTTPETSEQLHAKIAKMTEVERRREEAERETARLTQVQESLTLSVEGKAKDLDEATALCEVRKAEKLELEATLERLSAQAEAERERLTKLTVEVAVEEKKEVDLSNLEYEVGARVYLANTSRKFIGVVTQVERTANGKFYHVSWTGGQFAKGTHTAKELWPESYTPPPPETALEEEADLAVLVKEE